MTRHDRSADYSTDYITEDRGGAAGSRQQGADSDMGKGRTGGYGWLVLRVSYYLGAF